VRASLDAYVINNILVIDARLVLQVEKVFEQGKVWEYDEESFTQMHEDDNLLNRVRVKMN
jgi:hypothetical protein